MPAIQVLAKDMLTVMNLSLSVHLEVWSSDGWITQLHAHLCMADLGIGVVGRCELPYPMVLGGRVNDAF